MGISSFSTPPIVNCAVYNLGIISVSETHHSVMESINIGNLIGSRYYTLENNNYFPYPERETYKAKSLFLEG
jgi:hypothetical protein